MAVEMIVLNPCAQVDGILRTPRSPSTMQHTVVKDDHITGLCGDPTGTGEGQPLPHHHPTNGREPRRLALPANQARLAAMRAGNQPEFEPRFSVGLEVQGDACTSIRRGRLVPVFTLTEGAVDVVAVPSRRGVACVQVVVMQIHGFGSEHLTRKGNEAFIDEQMLEGRHLSHAGRRGPLPRNAVPHIVEISVRHSRVFDELLT